MSDQNINELLGVREINSNDEVSQCPECGRNISKGSRICTHCGKIINQDAPILNTTEVTDTISYGPEKALNVIAIITLWCGIICGIIGLFVLTTHEVPHTSYYSGSITYEKEFNPMGLAISLGFILSGVMWWALFRVFANISTSLKQINAKMKTRK